MVRRNVIESRDLAEPIRAPATAGEIMKYQYVHELKQVSYQCFK